MAQGSFSSQVSGWVAGTKDRRDRVYRESAKRVIQVMQRTRNEGGNLRFDTGFLRASLVVTLSDALPAQTFKPDGVAAFPYDPGGANLVIAGAHIKDPITAVYTANYARPREYGAKGQTPDRFVALAAQQWQTIVNQVCAEAQSRAGG